MHTVFLTLIFDSPVPSCPIIFPETTSGISIGTNKIMSIVAMNKVIINRCQSLIICMKKYHLFQLCNCTCIAKYICSLESLHAMQGIWPKSKIVHGSIKVCIVISPKTDTRISDKNLI